MQTTWRVITRRMVEYDSNSYKLYTQQVEAKLNKTIKALERAIKYKDIISRCPQCSMLLNEEE
jgi:uncharacterized protein with PIN domain